MIIPKHYKDKNIFIFGLGKDGLSALKAFNQAEANVFLWDDNAEIRQNLLEQQTKFYNFNLTEPTECDWDNIDAVILSPGVPFTHPEPAEIVVIAQKHNVRITCTVEIFFETVTDCKIVGVTGTNGKSTTTALLHHIIKYCGQKCELGGNFGIPILDLEHLPENSIYVIELSSYQLDLLDKFTCDIAILLNITPDHIARHGSFEGYVNSKKKIFNNMDKRSTAIIGFDNENTKQIYSEEVQKQVIGRVFPISGTTPLANGVFVIGSLCHNMIDYLPNTEILGDLNNLPGKHNAENIAAAYAAGIILSLSESEIIKAIKNFPGLIHRMQYIGEIANIKFINDSKATNAESTEQALEYYTNIYWIAGGSAKEGGISELSKYFYKIKKAYFIGDSAEEFAEFAELHQLNNMISKKLFAAIHDAFRESLQNNEPSVILLSPSAASFDQYKNFEERGNEFIELYNN
ncbi:MAG: UDP-N-acetylmuramoyl-L-alanine--D-glutamate ligase, partial [Pseudomonadota bacterium]